MKPLEIGPTYIARYTNTTESSSVKAYKSEDSGCATSSEDSIMTLEKLKQSLCGIPEPAPIICELDSYIPNINEIASDFKSNPDYENILTMIEESDLSGIEYTDVTGNTTNIEESEERDMNTIIKYINDANE